MADALTPNYEFTQPEIGGSDDTWGNKLNENWTKVDNLLKTKFDELAAADKIAADVGDVKMRAYGTVPTGWLECNGVAVSRAAPYDKLFAVIGTIYGVGDGVLTFNVPDYRGEFLRGWDHGRGVDPARTLGGLATEFQPDGMKSHSHGTTDKPDQTGDDTPDHYHNVAGNTQVAGQHTHTVNAGAYHSTGGTGGFSPDYDPGTKTSGATYVGAGASGTDHYHVININSGGASARHHHPIEKTPVNTKGADETRPRNQTIMYVIKF